MPCVYKNHPYAFRKFSKSFIHISRLLQYTDTMQRALITLENCRIENAQRIPIASVSWTMRTGEVWLVTGSNGGGKAAFLSALAGAFAIVPNGSGETSGRFFSEFNNSSEIVSLERAAALIQEERDNDESEYCKGGVDIGRTGRAFIAEALAVTDKKNPATPELLDSIAAHRAIKLCGIERVLERGLKYMSTGEIRRTLLARAIVSEKKLLILSDPFAGLDAESRTILKNFFNAIALEQRAEHVANKTNPYIILGAERYIEIPDAVTHVLEFNDGTVSFCGVKGDYEKIIEERRIENAKTQDTDKAAFVRKIINFQNNLKMMNDDPASQSDLKMTDDTPASQENIQSDRRALIEMRHVNVGWDGHAVLVDLNWTLYDGEHWLIKGPNGSGKTTFLELITGDNMQVYSNDVRVFGSRRGSGETMWDIKAKLGIVSYRMHVEYRMLGGTALRSVVVSGFRDSIGLYGKATDMETAAAERWLSLGGFSGRGSETFSALSYGEQRAVLILRAAVKCPLILVLDEPCHGLDENHRRRVLDLLETIAESGTTTLLHVTHERDEALACEKHILELHPGKTPMYTISTI